MPVTSGSYKKGHKQIYGYKKGNVTWNRLPVGAERWDWGYLYIKVALPAVWKPKHRWVYEQKKGPIPPGAFILFKDGNRANCKIRNLKMITRAQSVEAFGLNNCSPELRKVIQLRGVLNRFIKKGK